uniref:RING-type domain-containing protein n=1 Tax=Meloidogyne incognita TaxID=6306 RepID=A0A914M7H8_MELIC
MALTFNEAKATNKTTCPICLKDFEEGERIEMTDCIDEKDTNKHYNHFYHRSCMVDWIKNGPYGAHKTCPTCRSELKVTHPAEAEKINENLKKLGWGFEDEIIVREN